MKFFSAFSLSLIFLTLVFSLDELVRIANALESIQSKITIVNIHHDSK